MAAELICLIKMQSAPEHGLQTHGFFSVKTYMQCILFPSHKVCKYTCCIRKGLFCKLNSTLKPCLLIIIEQSCGHLDVGELKLPASSPSFGWMEITRIYSLQQLEFHYFPVSRTEQYSLCCEGQCHSMQIENSP